MKEWYKKYINYIVVGLLCLYGLKSCQSCSRQNQIEWQASKYEATIDTLNIKLQESDRTIMVLSDSIDMYKFKMGLIEQDNKRLNESNQRIQRNNTTLINTNNQIINKAEKEDEKSK